MDSCWRNIGQTLLSRSIYRFFSPSVIALTGSPPLPRVPPSLGFSISHNVRAWSIGVLEKRGRDKIAQGPIPGEFTLGISLPYIWASTGNATILSRVPGHGDPSVKCCPRLVFLPVSPGTWRVGKAGTGRNAVINKTGRAVTVPRKRSRTPFKM